MKKIKFSNNSTKGNETQNQPNKSKRKILKAFGFGSLAVMMAVAGTFAFAPLGASPSLASASEISNDINTRADGENIKYAPSPLGLDPENDPVIYTTESGLEIKFGGAFNYVANGGGNETMTASYPTLASGKPLSGYPYFTMGTYSGYAVNWVIIGKSTSITNSTTTTYDSLTNWQSKTGQAPTYKYFFDNTYEASTPAGSAIKSNNTLSDLTARKLTTNYSALSSIPAKDEIQSDCVLCISETALGTTQYQLSSHSATYQGSNLQSYCSALYTSTLNLNATQKALIKAQNFTTNYLTQNKGSMSTCSSSNQYFFSLAASGEKFTISNYLTTNALRTIGSKYFLRSGGATWTDIFYKVIESGAVSDGDLITDMYDCQQYLSVRPACVVKIF